MKSRLILKHVIFHAFWQNEKLRYDFDSSRSCFLCFQFHQNNNGTIMINCWYEILKLNFELRGWVAKVFDEAKWVKRRYRLGTFVGYTRTTNKHTGIQRPWCNIHVLDPSRKDKVARESSICYIGMKLSVNKRKCLFDRDFCFEVSSQDSVTRRTSVSIWKKWERTSRRQIRLRVASVSSACVASEPNVEK